MSKIYYSLYDRLLHPRALARAFAKVRRAKGAPGVDGQTIADFADHEEDELYRLVCELRTKTYRPQPVRRVTIPKPGGGERNLGIPAVRDRIIQQALLDVRNRPADCVGGVRVGGCHGVSIGAWMSGRSDGSLAGSGDSEDELSSGGWSSRT